MCCSRYFKILSWTLILVWSLGCLVGPARAGDISVISTFVPLGPNFELGCNDGMVTVGTKTFTCPLVESEAKKFGIRYNGIEERDGFKYVLMTLALGGVYCTDLGGGYRLPEPDELDLLIRSEGNMYTVHGWPTEVLEASDSISHYLASAIIINNNITVTYLDGSANSFFELPSGGISFITCVRESPSGP